MTSVTDHLANMSRDKAWSAVSVEHTSAPDPMTAIIQTPLRVSGLSANTSEGKVVARQTVSTRNRVKSAGTLKSAWEKKLKNEMSTCSNGKKDGKMTYSKTFFSNISSGGAWQPCGQNSATVAGSDLELHLATVAKVACPSALDELRDEVAARANSRYTAAVSSGWVEEDDHHSYWKYCVVDEASRIGTTAYFGGKKPQMRTFRPVQLRAGERSTIRLVPLGKSGQQAKEAISPTPAAKPAPVAPWKEETKREPELKLLTIADRKKGGQMLSESKRHPGCHEVTLAEGNDMPKRWLVSLSEKVDAAVPFTDKPPRFGMPSATTEELQRRCSQKAGKNCTPILVTAEGVCVAGAVGLPEGMSCVCDLLKAKGHTPVHRSLPPHPGSSLVIATVRAALGLPQRKTVASPLVPAGGLPTWTAAVPKSVATCQPTFVEDVKRTIDAVRKRAGALEEYSRTIQGSFANVFEGWLSDADSTGPRATDEHASNAPFWSFRALLNLANQLYAKPYVPSLKLSDSEAKAVKRVLAEWPCELHFQSALSKDGMFVPKQHQKGGCRNQSCCFAHHNVLAEDGSLKCSSFGITVNGIDMLRQYPMRRLEGLKAALDRVKVKPTCSIELSMRDETDKVCIRYQRPRAGQEVHPSLVVQPAERRTVITKAPRQALPEMTAAEKDAIKKVASPEQIFRTRAIKLLKHPLRAPYQAQVEAQLGDAELEHFDFASWVKYDLDESELDTALLELDTAWEAEKERREKTRYAKEVAARRKADHEQEFQRARAARERRIEA